MKMLSAAEIGAIVGGEVSGDPTRLVQRAAPLEYAAPEAISFVATARYLPYLQATRAGVVLVRREWLEVVPVGCVAVVIDNPHAALQKVLTELYPPVRPANGIHPSAIVPPSVRLGEDVVVGAYSVIGEGVVVGSGTIVGAHVVIGNGCRIGNDVTVHPHVTLYDGVELHDRVILHSGARIGTDGFGYVWRDGAHRKVPQVGGCIIEADVEIGANVAVDRGSIGDTVIGAGSKLDNLVHLAHNVRIGRHVMLAGQVGIAGSTTIGDGTVMGGQVGVGGHLTVGPESRLAGQAGVIGDVPAGSTYSGYPARPHRDALRAHAGVLRLPEILRRLKQLEERLEMRADVSPPTEQRSASAE